VYAELDGQAAEVFVRDRGVGFDPEHSDPLRHGIRGSIIGRLARHGGTADIRSQPGEGTEVRLRLPLA
jgi:signal transduction histidine kinase